MPFDKADKTVWSWVGASLWIPNPCWLTLCLLGIIAEYTRNNFRAGVTRWSLLYLRCRHEVPFSTFQHLSLLLITLFHDQSWLLCRTKDRRSNSDMLIYCKIRFIKPVDSVPTGRIALLQSAHYPKLSQSQPLLSPQKLLPTPLAD